MENTQIKAAFFCGASLSLCFILKIGEFLYLSVLAWLTLKVSVFLVFIACSVCVQCVVFVCSVCVQCSVCSVQCVVFSVQCALFSV